MKMNPSAKWWLFLRWAVAMVWLYQGLWLKILAVDARHLAIVASAPAFLPPRIALACIGSVETLFGVALLLRWKPHLFAWMQIATLTGMNGAGILFGGEHIADIGGMLTMNLVFALAIWGLAHHVP